MKFLVFALFIVGTHCQANQSQQELIRATKGGLDPGKVASDFQKCISDIQPDTSDVEAFRRNEMPSSDKAKCFAACMFEQAGMMKDGAYDIDSTVVIMQQIFSDDADKRTVATQTARNCYNEILALSVTDKCELARLAIDCYQRTGPMFVLG